MTKFFFHPSLLLLFLDPGSEIRDPGSGMGKNQDPGSEIRDPGSGMGKNQDPGSEIRDPGSGMGKNQDPGSGINIRDPRNTALHFSMIT